MIVLQETLFAANQTITCSQTFSFPFFDNLVSMRAKRAHESVYLHFSPPPLLSAVNNSPAVLFSHTRSTISKEKTEGL